MNTTTMTTTTTTTITTTIATSTTITTIITITAISTISTTSTTPPPAAAAAHDLLPKLLQPQPPNKAHSPAKDSQPLSVVAQARRIRLLEVSGCPESVKSRDDC